MARLTDTAGDARTDAGPTDAELLQRVARQDRAAVGLLFQRYQRRLFVYLARLTRDDGMAEELVNDVFLAVWRGAAGYRGGARASTWIFAIAHNRAVSALRRRREEPWDDEQMAALESGSDTPLESAEKAGLARAIDGALAHLSADHRAVIGLTYYHGMSVAEIAEVVDVPVNTVKTRMFHARKRLRQVLEGQGISGDDA